MDESYFQKKAANQLRLEKLARKILGVNDSAHLTDLKKAFWLLAMKYHPDKNPGDKETLRQFQNIKNAYDFLVNGKADGHFHLDRKRRFPSSVSDEFNTDNPWGYFLWWKDKYFG